MDIVVFVCLCVVMYCSLTVLCKAFYSSRQPVVSGGQIESGREINFSGELKEKNEKK
jgi:hypothetical protein